MSDNELNNEVNKRIRAYVRLLRMTVGTREMVKEFIQHVDDLLTDADSHLIVAVVCRHTDEGAIKTVMCPTPYDELSDSSKLLVEGVRKVCNEVFGDKNLLPKGGSSERIH